MRWDFKVSTKTSSTKGTKGNGEHVLRPIGSPAHRFLQSIGLIFNLLLYTMPDGEAKSGRTGSVVYQKNGVRRNFTAPPVFTTARAGAAKGLFSLFQTNFTNLTDAVQIAWNAAGFTSVNRVNKVIAITGRSGYARLNVNLTNSGQATLISPPVSMDVAPPILGGSVDGDDSAHSLKLNYTPNTDTGQVIVSATLPQRPSIFKPAKGKFKIIGLFDGTVASPVTLTTQYDTVFGTNAVSGVGKKIFIDVVTISATGNASPTVRYVGIIVA